MREGKNKCHSAKITEISLMSINQCRLYKSARVFKHWQKNVFQLNVHFYLQTEWTHVITRRGNTLYTGSYLFTYKHTRSASCGDDVSFTGDALNTEHFTLNLQGRKHNTTVKLWRESCLIMFHGSWFVSTMIQEKQTRSLIFWRFTTEIYEQQRTSGRLFISFTLEWSHNIQIVTITVVF